MTSVTPMVPGADSSALAGGGTVRPERLLDRRRLPGLGAALPPRAARAALRPLLNRLRTDQLTIVEPDGTATTWRGHDLPEPSAGRLPLRAVADDGTDPAAADSDHLRAELQILDERAWSAVAGEGSIGLGRAWIEGWWTTDDLVTTLRVLTRNLQGLDDLRNRWEQTAGGVTTRIRRLLPRPDRSANREDIASHYDLGNDFFALFLDETMTYSSAVFTEPAADLATASLAKYDRLLAKLGLSATTSLLEIGTGWGGLAMQAAATVGCPVTTTTISVEQRAEARRRVSGAGLDGQVTVLDRDWRDLTGRFDRIVSIEMIEAVDWRHHEQFFATLEDRLAPDGLIGLQAICVPDRRYERAKKTEDFIRRFVFPGGNLPSIGSITRSMARAGRLQLLDVEDFSAHYAETLARWRERFQARRPEITALGLDERFCRLWLFYLAYCEAGFRERHCTVNQFVLAGPRWRPRGLELRPC